MSGKGARSPRGSQSERSDKANAGDADSGRGVAPDVGDMPDTGTSSASPFIMDDEGYWERVDALENEYLSVNGGSADDTGFQPYKHSFVIFDTRGRNWENKG